MMIKWSDDFAFGFGAFGALWLFAEWPFLDSIIAALIFFVIAVVVDALMGLIRIRRPATDKQEQDDAS